jgi:hypothetical protein
MSSPLSVRNWLFLCGLASAFPLLLAGQSFSPQGGEYPINGALAGDQSFAQASVAVTGGYLVWQDNTIDGNGYGVAARRLDNNLSPGLFAPFRVNQQVAGDQEKPQVALLKNGGAAVVWQGGVPGRRAIWLRLLKPDGTFLATNEVRVNTFTNADQLTPVVAALPNGKLAIAWSSLHQDGSLQGIYARLFNTNGTAFTAAFPVNQFTNYNQRNPAIAALTNGNFVVTWASENQGLSGFDVLQGTNRVHVYARIFDTNGLAVGDEFRANAGEEFCHQPAVGALGNGGFTIVWAQRDAVRTNGWDIYARQFEAAGAATGPAIRMNGATYGDQFAPRIASVGLNQLVVWTSLGQDGSWEGVYGRVLVDGTPLAPEFRVNTTTVSRQMYPAVAADGGERFVVLWSSYVGETSFDLFAQRYASGQPLPQPAAPFVSALSSSRMMVTWPELSGIPLQGYEVTMDDGAAVFTVSNLWIATGLAPGSTHRFQLAYVLTDGQRSPKSPATTNTTWGEDLNGDGLPDDWQAQYWGPKEDSWPPGSADSDGDGVSNYREFLAGTNPLDPNSVLRVRITFSPQGRRLTWNTVPSYVYQVQNSQNFGAWSNLGPPRFAPGVSDSMALTGAGQAMFYRVVRVR